MVIARNVLDQPFPVSSHPPLARLGGALVIASSLSTYPIVIGIPSRRLSRDRWCRVSSLFLLVLRQCSMMHVKIESLWPFSVGVVPLNKRLGFYECPH